VVPSKRLGVARPRHVAGVSLPVQTHQNVKQINRKLLVLAENWSTIKASVSPMIRTPHIANVMATWLNGRVRQIDVFTQHPFIGHCAFHRRAACAVRSKLAWRRRSLDWTDFPWLTILRLYLSDFLAKFVRTCRAMVRRILSPGGSTRPLPGRSFTWREGHSVCCLTVRQLPSDYIER